LIMVVFEVGFQIKLWIRHVRIPFLLVVIIVSNILSFLRK